jgi:hypothetical protein
MPNPTKTMKTIRPLLAIFAALLAFFLGSRVQSADQSEEQKHRMEIDYINAQTRLITELAVDRFTINSLRGEKWLIAVHDGKELKKITDNDYTLVSLPAAQPGDRWAMEVFAGQFNESTLRAADESVRQGHFLEARRAYELLLKFACQVRGGWERDGIHQRLAYLDKIEKGEAVSENVAKLLKTAPDWKAYTEIGALATKKPVVVSNLLELESFGKKRD